MFTWWWWGLALLWLLMARRHWKLKRSGALDNMPPMFSGAWHMGGDDGPRWAPFRERGF